MDLPVIVNGDIKTADDARTALAQSGADGVMVGRACYGKPWKIKALSQALSAAHDGGSFEPNMHQKKETILDHYKDIIDYYGENQGVKIGRKHISWYVKDLPDAALFRKKVNTINESQAVCAEIDLFFDALR